MTGSLRPPADRPEALAILFEDAWLVAVNKPSGMAVHRGWAADGPIALQAVRDRVGAHVHPVHRLDRGASGVLLFTKAREILASAARPFATGTVIKSYLALVRGRPAADFTVDHPLRAERDAPERQATTHVHAWATAPQERVSLVIAVPLQGRLHQVRRHLKHATHPLIGDVRYGKGELNRRYRATVGLERLALHAYTLSLAHPCTGERLELVAPLTDDLAKPFAALGLATPTPARVIALATALHSPR